MPLAVFCLLLTSCSSFTQLLDTKSSVTTSATVNMVPRAAFLKNIEISLPQRVTSKQGNIVPTTPQEVPFKRSSMPSSSFTGVSSSILETCMPLQFKYAIMLNATVENVTNVLLYQTIDQWFGTRYRYGGTSHRGIDCSAFMQVLGQYAFGFLLPRTAHEQYAIMEEVEREDLHEGDFVFFNTHGGVSHVGMYLQNNKFIHASTSKGVMISDLNDHYWSDRIIGYKRMTTDLTSLN